MNGKPYCLIRSAMTSDCHPCGWPWAVSPAADARPGFLSMSVSRRPPKTPPKTGRPAICRPPGCSYDCRSVLLLQSLLEEGDHFRRLIHCLDDCIPHLVTHQRVDRQPKRLGLLEELRIGGRCLVGVPQSGEPVLRDAGRPGRQARDVALRFDQRDRLIALR